MRTVVLLGLLAILVTVGMLWSRVRSPRRVEPVLAPEPVASTEARREIEQLDALADARGSASLSLSGAIVAVDERGVEHRQEDGRIFLAFVDGGARSYIGAEVRGGRWRVDLARMPATSEPWVAIDGCTLRNRVALPEHAQPQLLPGPDHEPLELRVRWLPDLVIHVKTRDDGRELDEVVLEGVPMQDAPPPEPLGLFVGRRFGRSPVRIERGHERWLQPLVLHARGPDHAWASLEIAPGVSEVELLVDPAGNLELVVDAHPWHEDEEITLVAPGPEPRTVLEAPLRLTVRRVIEGLAPGEHVAEARCRGQLVGSQRVQIVAGEVTSATLVLQPPAAELVPLEGTLTIPAEWKMEDFRLCVGPLGRFDTDIQEPGPTAIPRAEMIRDEDSSERFHWSAGLVPAGRYQVLLQPLGFRAELDTGFAGTREASVHLPPPARVSFACVDARTGERVEGCRPGAVLYVPGQRRASLILSNGDIGDDPLVLPSGRLHLVAAPPGYEIARRDVLLEPGETEIALALWPR